MWRVLGASVEGTSHQASGGGCQDAHRAEMLDDGTLVVAVADGAGSALRAAEGAQLAVAQAVAAVRGDGVDLDQALTAAREGLTADMATTLLLVLARDGRVLVGQVGDGAVVLRRGDEFEVLESGPRREYLNETCFLTSDGWAEEARYHDVDATDLDGIAVMTDGLQLVALDLAASRAHPPFFLPLFAFAADSGTEEELAAFLASERLCQRTDDDKTLVLAVRVAEGQADGEPGD